MNNWKNEDTGDTLHAQGGWKIVFSLKILDISPHSCRVVPRIAKNL